MIVVDRFTIKKQRTDLDGLFMGNGVYIGTNSFIDNNNMINAEE